MATPLTVPTVLALAVLFAGCQATQKPIVVDVPKGIVLATENQKTFVSSLQKLSLGATKTEVERKLGKPDQAEGKTWYYHLPENRTQGGYYISATLSFRNDGLAFAKLDFGHETVSMQRR